MECMLFYTGLNHLEYIILQETSFSYFNFFIDASVIYNPAHRSVYYEYNSHCTVYRGRSDNFLLLLPT